MLMEKLYMDENTKIATTTGSAIGLGAIASFIGFCCVGPWAVTLFGVSGAIAIAKFAILRPYIISAGAILFIWAFWRIYRPQPTCDEEACVAGQSIWLKASLWSAAAMLIIAYFAVDIQWLIIDPTPEGLR